MTREEAIKVLTHELCDWEHDCKSYHVMKDALRMAIEALKQETVSRETYTHEYCLRKTFEMQVFELELRRQPMDYGLYGKRREE